MAPATPLLTPATVPCCWKDLLPLPLHFPRHHSCQLPATVVILPTWPSSPECTKPSLPRAPSAMIMGPNSTQTSAIISVTPRMPVITHTYMGIPLTGRLFQAISASHCNDSFPLPSFLPELLFYYQMITSPCTIIIKSFNTTAYLLSPYSVPRKK